MAFFLARRTGLADSWAALSFGMTISSTGLAQLLTAMVFFLVALLVRLAILIEALILHFSHFLAAELHSTADGRLLTAAQSNNL